MNDYPEYAEVEGKKYKINTDFRVAIKCNEIADDKNIGDYERPLAIIYMLFGDEGLNSGPHLESLLKLARQYLACGKDLSIQDNEKPDMDFIEDYAYIKTSFRSDYGINLDHEDMHWWEFFNLLNGLSNSELGNCCVLNRIRNIRNFDTRTIKDLKERQRIEKMQKNVALKKYKKEENLTKEQEKSMEELNKMLGL